MRPASERLLPRQTFRWSLILLPATWDDTQLVLGFSRTFLSPFLNGIAWNLVNLASIALWESQPERNCGDLNPPSA